MTRTRNQILHNYCISFFLIGFRLGRAILSFRVPYSLRFQQAISWQKQLIKLHARNKSHTQILHQSTHEIEKLCYMMWHNITEICTHVKSLWNQPNDSKHKVQNTGRQQYLSYKYKCNIGMSIHRDLRKDKISVNIASQIWCKWCWYTKMICHTWWIGVSIVPLELI